MALRRASVWIPAVMGMGMGAMILWMMHAMLTAQTGTAGPALLIFVLAHGVAVAGLVTAAPFAARLSPRLRTWVENRHRPSVKHIATMLTTGLATMAVIHLALHGGPSWT